MNYYIDTEFLEGKQDKRILGFKYGETKPTIDLISIGIVSEDNREYYAISKDFNLYEAWNRYDEKINNDYNPSKEESHYNPMYIKEYWIRENVLKPIFDELNSNVNNGFFYQKLDFNYSNLKKLINKHGKTNKQIAEEILIFISKTHCDCDRKIGSKNICKKHNPIKFYGYYSDYDHVVLCQLFGKMIDLPKGFPMYTIDLKQELDNKAKQIPIAYNIEEGLKSIKLSDSYPKQINKHNALSDAKWDKELHNFLKTI